MTLQLPPAEPARLGLLRRVLRPRPAAPSSPSAHTVETVDRDGRIRVQRVRR